MYISQTPLPHRLPPQAYWSQEYAQRDQTLLRSSWHLVATSSQLEHPGDFVTCEILGVPLQVRNFRGELRALSNVCAHRHCLISSLPAGNSPRMRCQYHGWEYSSQGRPCKIPAPSNFVPFPENGLQLPLYRVEQVGQLVFVCLDGQAPSLQDQLGPLYPLCQQRFGPGWSGYFQAQPEYAANWKVAVENSLESYHVPCVHPHTFGEDPGSQRSRHDFFPQGSSFTTQLPFAEEGLGRRFQGWEGQVVRALGRTTTDQYRQYHVFPNLLFSFTDAISFCQCLLPLDPQRSRAHIVQFGLSGGAPWQKALSWGWGRLKGALSGRIVAEDQALFEAIQKGLQASQQAGILGKCEERLHAFQCFLEQAYAGFPPGEANLR